MGGAKINAHDSSSIVLLRIPFEPLSLEHLLAWIDSRVKKRCGGYVCAVNASSIVQAWKDGAFRQALLDADINLPDGAPVAWAISLIAGVKQSRLAGPTVMLAVLSHARARRYRVVLYGSTTEVLRQLVSRVIAGFPGIEIVDSISPPFRPLTSAEDAEVCDRIRRARSDIVLVGLGAPKQEKWMRAHRSEFDAVMIGVGAGFDFNAGLVKRAPSWMQSIGLEWLYRLMQEPKRLSKRYATTLPLFAWRLVRQLLAERLTRD